MSGTFPLNVSPDGRFVESLELCYWPDCRSHIRCQ